MEGGWFHIYIDRVNISLNRREGGGGLISTFFLFYKDFFLERKKNVLLLCGDYRNRFKKEE